MLFRSNKVVIIGQVNLLRKTFMSLVLLTALSASVLAFPASADPQTAIIDTGLTPGASLEVTSEYGNLTLGKRPNSWGARSGFILTASLSIQLRPRINLRPEIPL